MTPKRTHKTSVYRSCCAAIVKSIHAQCRSEKQAGRLSLGVTRVFERTQAYAGMSSSVTSKLLKSNQLLPESERAVRRRSASMPNSDLNRIRPAIVALVNQKRTVTLNSLHEKLKELNPGWSWSRSSIWRSMSKIGFSYSSKRHNYYNRLKEDPANIALREQYITSYRDYRAEGRQFVFMDESWINKNTVPSRSWTDGSPDVSDKVPPGKGPRWILIGAGGEQGWVPESFRMWKGNVKKEDYHSEMNVSVFKHWLNNYLLPNVTDTCVLVMDRASYHCSLTEESKQLSCTLKKDELIEWIIERQIKDHNGQLYTLLCLQQLCKPQLWAICELNRPKKRFAIFDWLGAWNMEHGTDIRVLFLPVGHPQLNPIELIWSNIKQFVASNNHDFSMATIERLTRQRVLDIDSSVWTSACEHAHKFAMDYMAADELLFDEEETPFDEEIDDEDEFFSAAEYEFSGSDESEVE